MHAASSIRPTIRTNIWPTLPKANNPSSFAVACAMLSSSTTPSHEYCSRAPVGRAQHGAQRGGYNGFAFVRWVPKIAPIMKKRLRHRVRVIGILFAFAVATLPTTFAMLAGNSEARVTQAIRNVQLLAPNAAPRSASINGNVRAGTAVRTGSDSRAELTFTDRTLARLGANSVLSFGEGGFDLPNGSILLYLPKRSGGARISTAVAISQRWLSIVRNRGSNSSSSKVTPLFLSNIIPARLERFAQGK